jgi:hypothetical protein
MTGWRAAAARLIRFRAAVQDARLSFLVSVSTRTRTYIYMYDVDQEPASLLGLPFVGFWTGRRPLGGTEQWLSPMNTTGFYVQGDMFVCLRPGPRGTFLECCYFC